MTVANDKPSRKPLPEVDGRVLTTSVVAFIVRCQEQIEGQRALVHADNHLIGVLCDAVRLAREFMDSQKVQI
jgi:predicted short-subunit dehydrogenase-like oxidoreductase (DUF2520 family)